MLRGDLVGSGRGSAEPQRHMRLHRRHWQSGIDDVDVLAFEGDGLTPQQRRQHGQKLVGIGVVLVMAEMKRRTGPSAWRRH